MPPVKYLFLVPTVLPTCRWVWSVISCGFTSLCMRVFSAYVPVSYVWLEVIMLESDFLIKLKDTHTPRPQRCIQLIN